MARLLGGFCFGEGWRPEHIPGDIWAQVFAAHGAIRRAFNGGATFRRDLPFAGRPLTKHGRRDLCLLRQARLIAALRKVVR